MAEVFRAPTRRVDNAVTRLRDAASVLLMHLDVFGRSFGKTEGAVCVVRPFSISGGRMYKWCRRVVRRGRRVARRCLWCWWAGGYCRLALRECEELPAELGAAGLAGGLGFSIQEDLRQGERPRRRRVARDVAVVRQHLLEKVVPVGGAALAPAAPMGAHKKLQKILDVEAPRLRRQAAPATCPNVRHDEGSEAAVP